VNLLVHERLGFTEEFGGEHSHRCRAVADFIVLDFADVDKDFGGGVVERDGLEDSGAVVCY
jgi:hypothetical protein